MKALLSHRLTLILGALIVVPLAAAGGLFLLGSGGNDKDPNLSSYYFEAVMDSRLGGANPQSATLFRAWFAAPGKWRREASVSDPGLQANELTQVSDGEKVWSYNGRANTYFTQPYSETLKDPGGFFGTTVLIGPLPTATVEEYIERVQETGNVLTREGRLLGRRVRIVEAQMAGGAKRTTWIDARYPFVLKYEAIGAGPSQATIRVEVTEAKFNQGISDSRFRFDPPEFAREVAGPSQTAGTAVTLGPLGGRQVIFPAGFLTPSYLPTGYVAVRFQARGSASTGAGAQNAYSARLQPAGQTLDTGPYLDIDQQMRTGGLPQALMAGTHVRLHGRNAYRTDTGGETVLAFSAGDVVITVKTNSLPFDELVKVADSMQ